MIVSRLFFTLKTEPTNLVWAYGTANKFSKIRQEIERSWKSKEILLVGERDGKDDAVTESPSSNMEGMPNEEETGSDGEKDKGVKSSLPGKNHLTGNVLDKAENQFRTSLE